MLVKIYGAAPVGIDAVQVTIEVHAVPGYDFTLVGLPDVAIKESHERIMAALMVNGIEPPKRMFTINMAPADIKKAGASYDLPLAIGMLAGEEKIRTRLLDKYMIMGELSLDGTLQPIKGILPIALCAKQQGFRGIIVPEDNAEEAAIVDGLEVYGMSHLMDVVRFLNNSDEDNQNQFTPTYVDVLSMLNESNLPTEIDFSDVRGQENVRRAMEVAAAGGHNMIMVGPPGAGKSMMAKRLPSILPPLSMEEALETTKIHSVAGLMRRKANAAQTESLIIQRPFRNPHHTITEVSLVGGGNNPRPGEISLAHNGVLFADELPEFSKNVLEVLRQPLEDREITVSRNQQTVSYPASFMLVAAMNPCPCGYYNANDPAHPCTCTPAQVHRYMSRISGPLMDRIDIQCEIRAVSFSQLRENTPSEDSATMRQRVVRARQIQQERFRTHNLTSLRPVHCNAQMTSKMMREYCQLDEACEQRLELAITKKGLSARAHDRILKVARTIADLDNSPNICLPHIMEAINYRCLDQKEYQNH